MDFLPARNSAEVTWVCERCDPNPEPLEEEQSTIARAEGTLLFLSHPHVNAYS